MPSAIIDPRLSNDIRSNLVLSGFDIIESPVTGLVDSPLSGHPDIQMFLHEENLFVHPDIDNSFLKKVEKSVNIIICDKKITNRYPGDICYNIACTGGYALTLGKNYTDQIIIDYLETNDIRIIYTNQGYSKCSTLIVDDKSIITSDKSIYYAATNAGIDSLLITQGYIDLPGYNYGFIGGSSGRFHDTIYLTGSIEHHPDCDRIGDFIKSKYMHLKILSEEKIHDAGTIFFLD